MGGGSDGVAAAAVAMIVCVCAAILFRAPTAKIKILPDELAAGRRAPAAGPAHFGLYCGAG